MKKEESVMKSLEKWLRASRRRQACMKMLRKRRKEEEDWQKEDKMEVERYKRKGESERMVY